eukprot:1159557-Pelagomonas_calceolata.AAC.23
MAKPPAVTACQKPLPAHPGPQTWQAYLENKPNKSSYSGCGQTWCLAGSHVCTTFAWQMHSRVDVSALALNFAPPPPIFSKSIDKVEPKTYLKARKMGQAWVRAGIEAPSFLKSQEWA